MCRLCRHMCVQVIFGASVDFVARVCVVCVPPPSRVIQILPCNRGLPCFACFGVHIPLIILVAPSASHRLHDNLAR